MQVSPGLDVEVKEGDIVELGGAKGRVIETPGHTKGHVSYFFPDDGIVFVGDTLFSVGCGKLLEGDAKTMWASLKKLMALPPETKLYCGHEYTDKNCQFALTIEPENDALRARASEVAALTEKGEVVNGRGDTPNRHDILTGTQPDGTAFAAGDDKTCGNWTKSGEGSAIVGHHDRSGLDTSPPALSWNSSHPTRGCSDPALASTGGAGFLYCFAAN